MVLTVEPGLYFQEDEGEAPSGEADHQGEGDHPYRGIGIRIEDDVLVTADGAEVLTRELPTDPDAIAGMVGSESDEGSRLRD